MLRSPVGSVGLWVIVIRSLLGTGYWYQEILVPIISSFPGHRGLRLMLPTGGQADKKVMGPGGPQLHRSRFTLTCIVRRSESLKLSNFKACHKTQKPEVDLFGVVSESE